MEPPALLRRATLDDVPRLIELAGETPEAPQWTEGQFAQVVRESHSGTARRALIVLANGLTVFGYVVISVAADEAELENVVVSSASRRHGIARRLCAEAMEWAQEHGAQQIWLEVRESNTPARGLYLGLGFSDAGKRARYYRDPEEDALIMCWRV